MLVNLPFHDDGCQQARALEAYKMKAVDVLWEREDTTTSSYRGVRDIAIDMLPQTYLLLSIQ
jgi:hypothetical protein